MAASEPTSWLFPGPYILVTLSMLFGALADDLGCFPFDTNLITRGLTPDFLVSIFGV